MSVARHPLTPSPSATHGATATSHPTGRRSRTPRSRATSAPGNDHDWGIAKLKGAGVKIKRISPAAKKAWATSLKDWPNERAQAVKAKKGIDMPTIMRAFIKANEEAGHKYPVNYKIN